MDWMVWLVVAVLVFLFLLALLAFFRRKKSKGMKVLDQKVLNYVHAHWIRILDMAAVHPAAAVVDLDRLLDYVLSVRGYEGTVVEKLKKAKRFFSDVEELKYAHRLRNKIVHEFLEVSPKEAKRATLAFKKALNDLGAQV